MSAAHVWASRPPDVGVRYGNPSPSVCLARSRSTSRSTGAWSERRRFVTGQGSVAYDLTGRAASVGTFGKVPAHRPRIHAVITEQEAIDVFTLASYLRLRLDAADRASRPADSQPSSYDGRPSEEATMATRITHETLILAKLTEALGTFPDVTVARGMGAANRFPLDGWALEGSQRFQFGDLRLETPTATIVV